MLQVPQDWINKTRIVLINTERMFCIERANKWAELVNKATCILRYEIFGDYSNIQNRFICSLTEQEMRQSLNFLINWKGLDLKKSLKSNLPQTMKDYEGKAKNWLNGRRAKESSLSFYPFLVIKAEQYAQDIANERFTDHYNDKLGELYFKALMYKYLNVFCGAKVHLNLRPTELVCGNSLKGNKTELTRLLRLYAMDFKYNEIFPNHRQQAIDYFKLKANENINKLIKYIQPQNNRQGQENNIMTMDTPNFTPNEIFPFKQIFNTINDIIITQSQQATKMSKLLGKIVELEENITTTDEIIDNKIMMQEMKKHGTIYCQFEN